MTADGRAAAGAAALATLLGALALTPVYSSGRLAARARRRPRRPRRGLLLRVGGPALLGAGDPGHPGPAGCRRSGVALVPLGQLFLVLACSPRSTRRTPSLGVLPTRAASRGSPACWPTGGRAARAGDPGPAAHRAARPHDAVRRRDRGDRRPAGRRRSAGRRWRASACWSSTASRSATITGGIGLVAHRRAGRRARPAALDRPAPAAGRPGAAAEGLAARWAPGRGGLRIGRAALLAGLVVGSVVPTLTEGSLATGLGGAPGSATGTSLDPVAELAGQLTLPEPIDLLRMDASVDDPGYLRAVTLDEYDANAGWTLSNLDGEASIADDDRLAPLPAEQRPARHRDDPVIRARRPVPAGAVLAAVGADAGRPEDDWRFDPATGTVFGRGGPPSAGRATPVPPPSRGPSAALLPRPRLLPRTTVQQRFTACRPRPARSPTASPSCVGTPPALRAGPQHPRLPDRPGQRLPLQPRHRAGHQRRRPGGLPPAPPRLLRAVRRGDGGHGAGRGSPAGWRWATPRAEQDDGSRLITSDDAHAWVEVYFEGLGWVPFDPTPIAVDRRSTCPGRRGADAGRPGAEAGPAAVPSGPTAAPTAARTDRADGAPITSAGARGAVGSRVPLVLGAGVARLVVVAAPAGARTAAAPPGGRPGPPAPCGTSSTATALDVGVRMHPAWTPRRGGAGAGGGRRSPRAAADADGPPRPSAGWRWPRRPASYGPVGAPAPPSRTSSRRCARRAAACWPRPRATSGSRPVVAALRWCGRPVRCRGRRLGGARPLGRAV